MPSRRSVLAAFAAASAGCVGAPGTGTESPTDDATTRTTDTPSGTTRTTTTATGPAITGVRVQRSYVGLLGPHHMYVRAEPGRQYVLVGTDAEAGSGVAASVTLDGREYTEDGPTMTFEEFSESYAVPVVSLPLDVSPSEGAVTVGGTTRDLDAAALDRLAHPPEFDVTGFETPDSAEHGSEFEVSVSAAHRGGRDEPFRANLTNCTSQPSILEAPLSAGEEATVTERVRACDDPQAVELDWGYGSERREVAVASGTTTTES